MKHLNEVLRKYKTEIIPTMENAVGDELIKPAYRKKMKQEILVAWLKDLNEELDPEVADVLYNLDGIMIRCQNDEEGFYTIENMIKIKNMDYDPEYYEIISIEELEKKIH